MDFVFRNSDSITVMRLGRSVATRRTKDTSRDEIIGLITGAIQGDTASSDPTFA
jgi:ABC-type sugar transport system ATPase subunit